jgi:uncharacterized protein (TIGR03000 family)
MTYGGCYGGGVIYSGCYGGYVMPGVPVQQQKGKDGKGKGSGGGTGTDEASLFSATIVVTLPADAKLTIDDNPTTSTSGSRVFVSPALPPGKEYHYTLKAEAVREGKPVKVERTIAVRAGETTPVTLTLPPAGVAQH